MSRIDEESMEISKYSHKSYNHLSKQRPQPVRIINNKDDNSKNMQIYGKNSLERQISQEQEQEQDRDANSHFSQEKARIVNSDLIDKNDRDDTASNSNQIPKQFLDDELRLEYCDRR